MRYRQRTRDDTTTSGKVVEETTGSAIGSVDRTYKTLTRHKSVLQGEKDKAKSSPHDSGKSFRTVVVFNSAKNAPRCIHLKWLINRSQFNFSAMTVNPEAC
jgi:hypothetical protein